MAENIKTQIEQVLQYSQSLPGVKIDGLMKDWEINKAFLYKTLFKEQSYILQFPKKVQFDLTDDIRLDKLQTFIGFVQNTIAYDMTDYLANFLDKLTVSNFFNNLMDFDFHFAFKEIKAGTKILKAFKYLIDDKEKLILIQNYGSEIIQETKVEGYLCLSIHPLDYLSSSETTYKWRSCHSLDGEYRAGNLSYMTDRSTVVCYLKGENDDILPRFPSEIPWNSKKWRCLLHFDSELNVVIAGRQYPFFSSAALDTIRLWLNILLSKKNCIWSNWSQNYISSVGIKDRNVYLRGKHCLIGDKMFCFCDLIERPSLELNFNDILASSVYLKPYYMYKTEINYSSPPKFYIGNPVYCISCGKEYIVEANDNMLCHNCSCIYGDSEPDDYACCIDCGQYHLVVDMIDTDDGYVCSNCMP